MLKELRLNNLAIIKELDLEFGGGLISLTGETGAGKSIILDGISLLIGDRNNVDMIRNGEESLLAEGVFEITDLQRERLNELGFDIVDDELIITRYYDRKGKSKITVNGVRFTLSKLKELMSNILDLVGQHEHQYLLNKNFHLQLLDKFLGKSGKELHNKIKFNVNSIKNINKKIQEIEEERNKIMEKRDIYELQINDISSVNMRENEDVELEEEYKILFNAGEISDKINSSLQFLKNGEYSIVNFIGKVLKNFERLVVISDNFIDIKDKIEDIMYEIEEITYSLEDEMAKIDSNDARLEEVIKKLNKINNLKTKYGVSIKEILDYKIELEQKLNNIEFEKTELEKLKKLKKTLIEEYTVDSQKLREMRKEISVKIEGLIDEHLKDLNMSSAKFKVHFTEKKVISEKGMDDVEFMMITNVGDTFKSLSKIASGGEMSRIMISLKSVFSMVDNISVLIFDEIDTGISGETVIKVANKLRKLSEDVQVICVTHSPQIAGKSNQQFFIKKESENNKMTETKVRELNQEERIKEIARIISGDSITTNSINNAKEIMGLL